MILIRVLLSFYFDMIDPNDNELALLKQNTQRKTAWKMIILESHADFSTEINHNLLLIFLICIILYMLRNHK